MVQNILIYVITTLLGSLFIALGKIIVGLRTQREATKGLLRTEMVKAYYKYRTVKKMPYYIKASWYEDYKSYKKLGGNSFIDDLKEEIDVWEVE